MSLRPLGDRFTERSADCVDRGNGCLFARLLILLLNVPQVVAAAALAVYSIWFDRYEWRNVGVGVTYAAYVFLVILISQLVNGVGWLVLRGNKAMAAFWVRVALVSFSCVVVFIWLGGKFIYAGT